MAAAPDAKEVLCSTDGKANFQRLVRLLICGGTNLLREIFDNMCPPSNLSKILGNPATKNQLRAAKLTRPQWDCLYPSAGVYGKSTDFDVTLLSRLLRTICSLTPPGTGWDVLPASADHSLTADLVRIKHYRNSVYGHVKQEMEITNEEFPSLWQEISETLVRIAGQINHTKKTEWNDAIDDFLTNSLTEDDKKNVEELERWYKNDTEVKSAIEELKARTQQETDRLEGIVKEASYKTNEKVECLKTAAREDAQDIKDQLKEIKTLFTEEIMDQFKDCIVKNVQCLQTTVREESEKIKGRLDEIHQPTDRLSSTAAGAERTGGGLHCFLYFKIVENARAVDACSRAGLCPFCLSNPCPKQARDEPENWFGFVY